METQRKALSFKGQNIYIGIDVHLKSWSVTLMSQATQLKKFSQSPDPFIAYSFKSAITLREKQRLTQIRPLGYRTFLKFCYNPHKTSREHTRHSSPFRPQTPPAAVAPSR